MCSGTFVQVLLDEIESFGNVIDGLEEQRVQTLGEEVWFLKKPF